MTKLSSFIVIALLLSFISSCIENNHLNNALKVAGSNRSELEAVLNHYKDNPEKLAAARFLIENMLSVDDLKRIIEKIEKE
ncbi:MAG: hypothetical protein J6U22_03800 [Bacteroidaceae bacterium]|nr:hypothetical protein [Bacteroidaceae bacterium]